MRNAVNDNCDIRLRFSLSRKVPVEQYASARQRLGPLTNWDMKKMVQICRRYFKYIFRMKKYVYLIKLTLIFFVQSSINNKPALVSVMTLFTNMV